MSEMPPSYDQRRFDDEIELRDLIRPLWHYRCLITAVFVLAVATAGVISFVMAPVYQVHTLISLGIYDSPVYTQAGPAREIILSDDFIREVVDDLELGIPPERFRAFRETIKVEPIKDTNMLKISIETTDRTEGKTILERMFQNFYAKSQPKFAQHEQLVVSQLTTVQEALDQVENNIHSTNDLLQQIESGVVTSIDRDFRRSQILESVQGFEQQHLALLDRSLGLQKELNSLEAPQVVRSPREPVYPVKPNKKLNVALAGVLGLMVGVFLAFGLEYLRKNPLYLNEE
ncbi:MAG: Wzz/FepE/Etk N-terminal domain-containing protein [Clostridia bacterium]|nr:Wzz/FepE/Etk N-terminal domain-containing protein [Clostridia bacterium]